MASQPALLAQQDRRAGDIIAGRYVLQRQLGEGGMGVVWAAHSTALGVDVALKMLRPGLAKTEAVERMAREARTAAQLGHPALVRVLDFGTSELGEPFVVMELLQGEELHQRLQREQRLPAADAVALLLPVIDGLGIAHEKGIVHRDIKPENIFIAAEGQRRLQPKLLDFGVAKLTQDRAASRLTQFGTVTGSPYYLSPEQAEGQDDIDARADIWALGVVLYEALTGSPPFEADNYNALMRSITRDAPRPITDHGVGDKQLWLIIQRCLQKKRDERWASMWELGESLALWLFERGVQVDAAGRSLKHAWLDGGLTGVQILVPSETPGALETPTLPPEALPSLAPPSSSLARTQVRPRRRRSRVMPWLAASCAAAVVGFALVSWREFGRAAKPASTGSEVRPPAAVSVSVVAPASPTPSAALPPPPVAAEASAAVALPTPTPSATVSSARATSAPRSTVAKPKASAVVPAAPARVRHGTEFGF